METNIIKITSFTDFDAGISPQQMLDFEYSDDHSFTFKRIWEHENQTYSDTYKTNGNAIKNGSSPSVPSNYYNEWKNEAKKYIKSEKQTLYNQEEFNDQDPDNNLPVSSMEFETNNLYNYDWRKNPNKEECGMELTKRLNNMSDEDRSMFMKLIHFDFITDVMSALKNMKDTPEIIWKNIISKGQKLMNIKITNDNGFDFTEFLKVLLPALAGLAALMIGLKQAKKAEIESSDVPNEIHDNDPLTKNITKKENGEFDNNSEIDPLTGKVRSIILTMCDQQLNGYSLN